MDLPFLLERKMLNKVEKFVTNLHDKNECYTHKKFKTGIKSWVDLEKRVIKFNQKDWLKPDIDMNTELRQKTKNFEKDF